MTDTPWWHEQDRSDGDPGPGAAAEAAKLFEVIRDRVLADPASLRAGLRLVETFTALRGAAAAAPGDAPECAYCPVCQAIRQARSLNPETVERLTGAALEFAETVRQTMAAEPDVPDDGVRHVPLDDDWDEPSSSADATDDEGFAGWAPDADPR